MLCRADFIEQTGLSAEKLEDIMELGWIEIHEESNESPFFSDSDIYRVRKLMRICQDFELPVIGGTIIVDLLERISFLEERIHFLEAKNASEE